MQYVMEYKGYPHRRFFEDICAIPHESFNEEAISEYLVQFAKDRNLWWYRDELWNVVIKKEASPGYEDHPPVMLQAHTDMVCVKLPHSDFNFRTDSLKLFIEDGWIKAKDTTLGADCGHGVAYMLAALDDNELQHPPLECFFSVQEEVGIGGPKFIDYSIFKAKKLINFDIFDEGLSWISTTSVKGGDFIKRVQFESDQKPAFKVSVSGGVGGHAALDIGRDQVNAIKICTRYLYTLMKDIHINLVSIDGGTARNNIAGACEAVFTCATCNSNLANHLSEALTEKIRKEYAGTDPGVSISISPTESTGKSMDRLSTENVIELLLLLPTGAYMRRFMSNGLGLIVKNGQEGDGLVITSRNLGVVSIKDDTVTIGYMFRSALASQIEEISDQAFLIANRYGAAWNTIYDYAGHTYSEDAPMHQLWKEVYKEATGNDVKAVAAHVGTDVGTIVQHIKDMDVITLGPNTIGIHKPGEKMEIASFDRTYGYFKTILAKL
jgi:aminoacyl-histidine dipeptidase